MEHLPKISLEQRDLILISYPFSNLKQEKVRPVVIISNNDYNKKFQDIIVVPLTTNLDLRDHSIIIKQKDIEDGKLVKDSLIKVDRLSSIKKSLAVMKIGKIRKEVHEKIIAMLTDLVK